MILVLRKELDNRENKRISTDDLTKMAEFVLKNNYFEFNRMVKKQISGTAIRTKFTRVYLWTKLRLNFLKRKSISL